MVSGSALRLVGEVEERPHFVKVEEVLFPDVVPVVHDECEAVVGEEPGERLAAGAVGAVVSRDHPALCEASALLLEHFDHEEGVGPRAVSVEVHVVQPRHSSTISERPTPGSA